MAMWLNCLVLHGPNCGEKHAGELFDMRIDSAGTDLESEILIKMDSGYPPRYDALAVSEMPHDQWFSVSVPVSELIKNAGSLPLNTSEIVGSVRVGAHELGACHGRQHRAGLWSPREERLWYPPSGGEVDSVLVPVFTDEIAPIWDRGACAYDTTVGGDYCEPDTLNLIT